MADAVLIRLGPPLTIFLLAGPIGFGLIGTLLPALGFLPALGGMAFTLDHMADAISRPGMVTSMTMSLLAGLVTVTISLAAVFLFVAAFAGTRLFDRVQHLISPLLSVPHAAAAFGLAFLISPSGIVSRSISPGLTGWTRPPDLLIVNDAMGISMVAGLIVKEIPFLLLVTLAALPQVRLQQTRVLTASLGYGGTAGFLYTLWPNIYRQIRLAVFAVIAFATSVVDVAAILGPTTPAPLAVRIVDWMSDPDLSARYVASAGAVLQLMLTALALGIWIILERLGAFLLVWFCDSGARFRHDRLLAYSGLAAMTVTFFAIAGGLVTLAVWSVAGLWQFPDALPNTISLRTWMQAGPRIADPLVTTLAVATLATGLAAALAILCLMREDQTQRRGNRSIWLIYLPLLVPQAAFLFGLQLLIVILGVDATFPALVFVHLIFVLPYVFLSLSDPWRAFDRRYDALAAGLGKRRWVTLFRIRLPMLIRAVLTAAAVGFAVSIGQYLPTVLIGAGRLETITTEAVALASGGNRRVIGVYAFLQMSLPAIGFLVATAVPALLFRSRRAMRV